MGLFCIIECGPPPPTKDYKDIEPAPSINYGEKMRQAWLAYYEWENDIQWDAYKDCFGVFENLLDNFFEEVNLDILLDELEAYKNCLNAFDGLLNNYFEDADWKVASKDWKKLDWD